MANILVQDAVEAAIAKNELSETQKVWLRGIIGRGGQLRSSRNQKAAGEAQYIWRMIAFYASNDPKHHCIPGMADLWIDVPEGMYPDEKYDFKKVNLYIKEFLDPLINMVMREIPPTRHYGVRRWAKAFGQE